ncbi:putative bifunctional diguanylate cyclase/phosphodiesterase [Cryptosporangium phraense]|uniref:Bifunctional diguanylate cyclase/phosphodiesterase n=1 Tax=Cryptosporangium phraense TaxID=2593070 RepID=A0A545AE07_9ACTN|nr:bifunctional diguanylate cyclase/phosphodiesterase [Cryptosporangium phraense]TQS39539.1 bifunctional diguanylate cyclase/phosphodiesterase [Cryptosporangium phraense]
MAKRSAVTAVSRVVWLVVGVLAVVLAIHLGWVWSGHSERSPVRLWSPWALVEILLGVGLLLVVLRCVLMPAQRLAWALIGAMAATTGAGYVVWDRIVSSGVDVPSFSLADAFWLPALPLLGVGVWRLSRPLVGGVGTVRIWDAVAAGLLGASVMALVLGRSVLTWTGGSPLDAIVTLGYPALTMVLVGMMGSIAALAGWRLDTGWLLLCALVLDMAVGNALTSRMLASGSGNIEMVDQLAGVAGLLIPAAAWSRPRRMADRPVDLRTLVAPLICAAAAVVVLLLTEVTGETWVSALLATLSVLAALIRVGFGVRSLLDAGEQHRLAITDELTGLYNRRGFLRGVEESLAAGNRRTRAVLLLDLDRFKDVNDGLGHQIGDQLLAALAPRLADVLGPDDLLGRLGGDEFAVLTSTPDVGPLAERLLKAVRKPLPVGGIAIPMDVSIGVAVEADAGDTGTVEERTVELLRCADTAMYRAKSERRGWVRYDSIGPDRQRDALERAAELRGLLLGMGSRERLGSLEMHYQALVATSPTAPARYEALVRWRHPQHGMIAPDNFIGLAERTGLTPYLTRRVLGMSLDQVAQWRQGGGDIEVSVNLSASDLFHPTLVDEVLDGLRSRGLPPSALTVEITEQVAIGDLNTGRDVLAELRRAGVGVAIDDFGTGYSALSYLQRLPATEFKLDRSLTVKLTDDPAAAAITRACIDLAHTLGLEVVAEGIETLDQVDALVAAGVERLQGWYFGKPVVGSPVPPSSAFRAAKVLTGS